MYIAYALIFLLVGGLEAILLRIQLAVPHNNFLSPEVFNRLFTMHGTTMVFLMGMPLIIGFANYLVPLMIGARDMAFPRMNAFSFWMTALGGLMLYYSFIGGVGLQGAGSAPDVTWWAYAPLTEKAFSRGHSTDYWALSRIVSGFGTIGAAVNIIATTLCMRCKGMTMFRMPLLAWLYLVVSGMILVTISPLTAAQIMLTIDRYLGGHFFDSQAGGSPVVWAHFFWVFGNPEVYVLVLPAFAIANEIIPVFSRKAIFGYPAMVAGISGHWSDQPQRVGAPHVHRGHDLGAECVLCALHRTGGGSDRNQDLQLDCDHVGRQNTLRYAYALLCTAFLIQFLFAGLTGIMLSTAPWNWQLHNSYFVIAHFHYVLVEAIVFCFFGGFYYWFPKMTGKMLDERLGKWHFWLFVIGFHMCFDLMHIPGLLGMPRSIYTYEPGRGWGTWNMLVHRRLDSGSGRADLRLQHGVFVLQGPGGGPGPVGCMDARVGNLLAATRVQLRQRTVVASRRPLWDLKHPEDPDSRYE